MNEQAVTVQQESDSFTERPITSALSGCLYAAFVIGISVGMLLINALACLTIYSALPEYAPPEISSRVGQFFFFTAPIVLMVLQWNLIDRVSRMFSSSK